MPDNRKCCVMERRASVAPQTAQLFRCSCHVVSCHIISYRTAWHRIEFESSRDDGNDDGQITHQTNRSDQHRSDQS